MEKKRIVLLSAAISMLVATSLEAGSGRRAAREERVIEVYKYGVNPELSASERVRDQIASESPLDGYSIQAYFVVFRLLPHERIVRAKAEVWDGFHCRRRDPHSGAAAGRALAKVGYGLALSGADSELRSGLSLLGTLMMPHSEATTVTAPTLERGFVLRRSDLRQHGDHVSAVVLLAASSVTRLSFPEITLRVRPPKGEGKKRTVRARTRPVLVPGPQDPDTTREELLEVLLGTTSAGSP